MDATQRYHALKQLEKEGYEIPEIPYIEIEAKDRKDAAEKLLQITSRYGEINSDTTFFEDFNIDLSFINDIEIPELDIKLEELESEIVEDEVPEPPIEPLSKTGDLWLCGKNRILCGDATKEADIVKLMDGKKANLLFTSPPYPDMRDYGGNDLSIELLIHFIPSFQSYIKYMIINLGIKRENDEIIEYWSDYIEKAKECGYKFLSWNVWNRSGAGGSVGAITALFPIEHEWIFVFGKNFNKDNFNKTKKNKHAKEHRTGGDRQKDGSLISKSRIINEFSRIGTVQNIDFERNLENKRSHPAVFPVKLPSEYINAITQENDIVVDCFLGSGTTLIAAHQTGRICYGCEIDPHYIDVILDRYAKFTGDDPIRESDGIKWSELKSSKLID